MISTIYKLMHLFYKSNNISFNNWLNTINFLVARTLAVSNYKYKLQKEKQNIKIKQHQKIQKNQ